MTNIPPNWRYQHDMRVWESLIQTRIAMFEAVKDFASLAIKSLILVNGGAVLALLTFLGNSDGKSLIARQALAAAAGSIGYFVWGVAVGVLTAGWAYVAQVIFAETEPGGPGYVVGNVIRVLGVLSALASLTLFCLGAFDAQRAFAPSAAEAVKVVVPPNDLIDVPPTGLMDPSAQ